MSNSADPDRIPVITEEQLEETRKKLHGRIFTCDSCGASFAWGAMKMVLADYDGCPYCLGKWDPEDSDQPRNPKH